MTGQEIENHHRQWSDQELLSHRESCLSEAEVQVRWGQPKSAAALRERAKTYTRAIRIRGIFV